MATKSKFYATLTLAGGQSTQWQVKVIPLRGHMQNMSNLCKAEACLLEKIRAYEITLTKGDSQRLTTINAIFLITILYIRP